MSQELFINVMSAEVRAALMEDASLIDLIVERRERASVVGNIYLGRVERVMKGMEAAFVDIGLGKSGFLGLDDNRRGNGETSAPVHEGEAVLVQVTKDAINGKGVQLSRRVTLPGRALVYAPQQDRVMVSRQIEDEAERRPLLEAWLGLQECLYAETADGSRVYAEFDPTQVGRGRLSAVQYLSFSLESGPVRLGSDFAALELTVDLTESQRAALAADLAATRP